MQWRDVHVLLQIRHLDKRIRPEGGFEGVTRHNMGYLRRSQMEQEAQILNENSADAANDIRLVGEVLRKDRKATAEFVERFADCVYSYVRRRLMPQAQTVEDNHCRRSLPSRDLHPDRKPARREAPGEAHVAS
jgi:hypothetical protein